jgi:hypothetical protein
MENCRRVQTSVEDDSRVLSREEENITLVSYLSLSAAWIPCKAFYHLALLCNIKLGFLGAYSKSRCPLPAAASTLSGVMDIAMLCPEACVLPRSGRLSCLRVMKFSS